MKTDVSKSVAAAMPEDLDVNVESLWIIGPRAKGGKRENNYHGNFVPQIPSDLIRRFTKEDDVVLEPFMGSGTTLFECERLNRRYIGFDINKEMVAYVRQKMNDGHGKFVIHQMDASSADAERVVQKDLTNFDRESADLMILHPPYFDIIRFTDQKCDLSNAKSLDDFISRYQAVLRRMLGAVRKNGHLAIVAGDLYRNSEVVPLGFMLMNATLQMGGCKLKGIVVKDMVGNRAKIGLDALWHKRALRSDYYLFKHEYIFVFRKVGQMSIAKQRRSNQIDDL